MIMMNKPMILEWTLKKLKKSNVKKDIAKFLKTTVGIDDDDPSSIMESVLKSINISDGGATPFSQTLYNNDDV